MENLIIFIYFFLFSVIQILKQKKDSMQDAAQIPDAELKQIYDQLLYKDTRIMELNQTVLERERRIMDLQEACSEQGQVRSGRNRKNLRFRKISPKKFDIFRKFRLNNFLRNFCFGNSPLNTLNPKFSHN